MIKHFSLPQGQRLDVALSEELKFTRSRVKNLIDEEKVLVNDKKVKSGYIIKVTDDIVVNFEEAKPLEVKAEKIEISIIFQNEDLLVINKPQGLVIHPSNGHESGTLVNALLYHVKDLSGINGVIRPGIVHRLDKDTSGLMLVAKNDKTHVNLQKQIQEKTCVRKYIALLEGRVKEFEGTIETFFGRSLNDRKKMAVLTSGKKAITHFKVLKYYQGYTLCEFKLETGRTHQIRVHAKFIGHPIIGDPLYGKEEKNLKGQLLHSYYINFANVSDDKRMEFVIDLPNYFLAFLKKIKPSD